MVYDRDFDMPLPGVVATIAETGEKVTGGEEGNFIFGHVAPGTYTLIIAKPGYTRQVESNVVVAAGQMTEIETRLSGEFTEMEEFVVQDIQIGGASEAGLLALRMESPALLDSVSADLMSQAGAGDAASALKLVAGTTVQDGKYAVVRGLPDRYVSAQMNGVRLPTADADKRAVQLDQFPSALIESIQVSKTFTPDQQGDASGGAVNVVLKGIPDGPLLKLSIGYKSNNQVAGIDDFLTYNGGGVGTWGKDDGGRDIRAMNPFRNIGEYYRERESRVPILDQRLGGGVGVTRDDAPQSYDWGITAGTSHDVDGAFRLGGLASFYYKRDNEFYDSGIEDAYWIEEPGKGMTPQYGQGSPEQGAFKTSLFDVTKGTQELQWGGLGSLGVETENHSLTALYMYTHSTSDTATLAEDTRGKNYYFPDYDPDDPEHPGNKERDAAPYLRNETLEYIERVTETLQFSGHHVTPIPELGIEGFFTFLPPEIDWTVAESSSSLDSPDKRLFSSQWFPEKTIPGFPQWGIPETVIPAAHRPAKPAATFTLGNLQRVWKEINEDSDQYFIDLKFPFEQWSGDRGYVKFGVFNDEVTRTYRQSSFSNFNDNAASFDGGWNDFWSAEFPFEEHEVTAANVDVNYDGYQKISAWYYMVDFPLCPWVNIIGGARYESTELAITNDPEEDVTWIPADTNLETKLEPGDADVEYEQEDILPAIGFVFKPVSLFTLRGSYSETVARQTFKELTPIQQMDYLGGDVFIGNPQLTMSALENYDLRLDITPFEGALISVSWFRKDITDPIEYVQKYSTFGYTTAVNYPKGQLTGYEFELRQQLGQLWRPLAGLTLGGNATLIDSEVTLPDAEAATFKDPNINMPTYTRDMMNAPEMLYNLYLIYEFQPTDTRVGIFYTVRGDMLVAGAGQSSGNYLPDVYEKEYGTLNLSVEQKLGGHLTLKFQAKNLTNPRIEEVYRSGNVVGDVVKSSYTKGIEYSIGISGQF